MTSTIWYHEIVGILSTVGDAMFAFISETYQKIDGSAPEKRMAMRVIEFYCIKWCRTAMIDCPTIMKNGGIDARGILAYYF